MLVTTNWETGEVTKELVDKVKRHKVSRIKKAIQKSRLLKKERFKVAKQES